MFILCIFFYLELIVSTENIYYGIINKHSVVFLHAFERNIQNIPTPKKYPARPGNALLGITDAKEEIIMSNKIYFQTADRRVCP